MNDEFYIGWEAKAAPGIGRGSRRISLVLFMLALVTPVALAISQHMIGTSVFEWGTQKTLTGILKTVPYPHLLVARPGQTGSNLRFSSYYLVAPWKFGLDTQALARFDGKSVRLIGTLIYRGDRTMVETRPDWIQEKRAAGTNSLPEVVALGKQTLIGEIVDSKCFLGVMNPGQLTPHRGCAIRCISGGVPPVLLVRQMEGAVNYFLLVSAEGKPVNKAVLDLVAEPVEITGDVERQGEILILRADPATYRRAARSRSL
jgi:hypothetical protein